MRQLDHQEIEDIAAFRCGTLSEKDEDRVRELLATSEEAYQLFADSVRGDHELPSGRETLADRTGRLVATVAGRITGPVAGSHHAHGPDLSAATPHLAASFRSPLAKAAALAGLLTIGATLSLLFFQTSTMPQGSELASALLSGVRPVAAGDESWLNPPWSITRGATTPLTEPSILFRLGVRATDVQVALGLSDLARTAALVDQVTALLRDVPFAEPYIMEYASLAVLAEQRDPIATTVARSASAEEALRAFLESVHFDLGRWNEGARLAVDWRADGYFTSSTGAKALRYLGGADLSAATRRDIAHVMELVSDGITEAERPQLRQLVEELFLRHSG